MTKSIDPAFVVVKDLVQDYRARGGLPGRRRSVRAVDKVSFAIGKGETLGLVGESGSGKSTAARAMLRLIDPTSGEVYLDGVDVLRLSRRELHEFRHRMQIVFQDPFASLNPRMRVGAAVREVLAVNGFEPDRRDQRVRELFELVGLTNAHMARYPHELSGGQRQRIGIARALATSPEFIVADEAISALDVSVQAQIVNLLQDLRDELDLTYLFISHDLSMVRHICDRIAVLYMGRLVEVGPADLVYSAPLHPYTLALLSAVPVADPDRERQRERLVLSGDVPDPANPPAGCRFHTRCPFATEICASSDPPMKEVGENGRSHEIACHHVDEVMAHRASYLNRVTGSTS